MQNLKEEGKMRWRRKNLPKQGNWRGMGRYYVEKGRVVKKGGMYNKMGINTALLWIGENI